MLLPDLDREAEVTKDVALQVYGKDWLANVGIEGQKAVPESLLVVRGRWRHGNDGDSETMELETLHWEK